MAKPTAISGIVFTLCGIGLLSIMDAFAKTLQEDGIDAIQIIAMRSWLTVPILFLSYAATGQLQQFKPQRPLWVFGRGFIGFFAPYLFFKSLETLSLADATVMFFSSTFIITALSSPILKERVGIHRWSAVTLGFVGVIIAVEPKGDGNLTGYLYCIIGSTAYAILFLTGRILSRTESTPALVLGFNITLGVMGTMLLPLVWQAPTLHQCGWLLLLALVALAGHLFMTEAFKRAEASLIAPFEYSALLWSVAIGYIFWNDFPTTRVLIGAGIIICCGLYVIYREFLHTRRQRAS